MQGCMEGENFVLRNTKATAILIQADNSTGKYDKYNSIFLLQFDIIGDLRIKLYCPICDFNGLNQVFSDSSTDIKPIRDSLRDGFALNDCNSDNDKLALSYVYYNNLFELTPGLSDLIKFVGNINNNSVHSNFNFSYTPKFALVDSNRTVELCGYQYVDRAYINENYNLGIYVTFDTIANILKEEQLRSHFLLNKHILDPVKAKLVPILKKYYPSDNVSPDFIQIGYECDARITSQDLPSHYINTNRK
jgi:hypothetical protein